MASKKIDRCRICSSTDLVGILDLGEQYFTGIFPKSREEDIPKGRLKLVKCNHCGLVQLEDSFDLDLLYGKNYGYRSGLNQSMIAHLNNTVKKISEFISLTPGDLVLDIGSNDSTLLQAYPKNVDLVGIDPTGIKFKNFYPDYIRLIPEFFSKKAFTNHYPDRKAKIVTSIAMFYDLDNPTQFMQDIYDILEDNGVWYFEQSYLLSMLETNSYDTICHEHLEYYALKQIKWMTDKVGFRIISIEMNKVNGGSFSILVCKNNASFPDNSSVVNQILANEEAKGINGFQVYKEFNQRIEEYREKLKSFLIEKKKEGKLVIGYGASTKGNVILQYCNITEEELPFIAEVNPDKFGSFTPGTKIPIISEKEAREMNPDIFLVLPWHFKDSIVVREREFLQSGGRLLFPLPYLELLY
ncbi:C-methyltransferase [Leptospira ryugenii]|uniref:C-methyltransferase n=1 Tax=Leptospira ryugenii TaxID=1917863 RepID=A0A2P2DW02_9LEPT|nr:class I SAM-dependent methyltransferase [Leptospira ryugenii]GBF48806.1 C-methyltransferase [Leptospira ryugenii]